MSTGKALLAVLAGIAAGAAIGVIFAPKMESGSRKKLSKKGEDLANALNDTIDEKFEALMQSINGKVKSTKSNATEIDKRRSEFVN
jgi:gas vesicle protein